MSVTSFPGNPEIPLKLRKSSCAKRMTLRVSRIDGAVVLTLPRGVSERTALAFAEQQRDWVLAQLSRAASPVTLGPGCRITVAGQELTLVAGSGARVRIADGVLYLPEAPETARIYLQAWLKEQARAALTRASDRYCDRLGRRYSRITLRDTRSRWGSCSSTGGLMYSWRLILAPTEVLDYVAAHEVAHLQEMNHSAAFWHLVGRLYGPYQEARGWLRQYGSELHRYRFDA